MLLIVPGTVTSDSAEVWVGQFTTAPPGGLTLRATDENGTITDNVSLGGQWTQTGPGTPSVVFSRRVSLRLTPDANHRLEVLDRTRTLATGAVESLPSAIPPAVRVVRTRDSRPFTVFLGSCFHHLSDPAGAVGFAYSKLFDSIPHRPHLKFLCGDQVYLDAPFNEFLQFHGAADLWARFIQTYRRTWGQGAGVPVGGFHDLLSNGANWFLSDDHEFWNGFPEASYPVNSWNAADRGVWGSIARELYLALQAPAVSDSFAVGGLEFFTADTRFNRTMNRSRFMAQSTFSNLQAWIQNLQGPGVLVLPQPLIDDKGSVESTLPDYGQYMDLVRTLQASNHDVVLLTGDKHFGRVSEVMLNRRARLIEVVASPMSLVHWSACSSGDNPPGLFPVAAAPGVGRRRVAVLGRVPRVPTVTYPGSFSVPGTKTAEHAMTLGFTTSRQRDGTRRIQVQIRAWLMNPSNQALPALANLAPNQTVIRRTLN